MRQTKTLKHKILNNSRIFDATIDKYNQALHFIIEVMNREFPDLNGISNKSMVNAIEKLIHSTSLNPQPKYPQFDKDFYKFPSYFRRSAIADAYGKLKSYRTTIANWAKEKEESERLGKPFKKKPPTFNSFHKEFPIFYKGNMFKRTSESTAKIKIYYKNDWVWTNINYRSQNLFKRGVLNWKENNPKLVRVGHKYFLNISYETDIPLKDTEIHKQIACSVDLGLTNTAVCSVINAKGTVLARKFINQTKEKDRLYKLLNKLKVAQRNSGYIKAPNYWRRIQGLQQHIVRDTSHQIIEFAKQHGANIIVFEYLKQFKIPKGFRGAKRLRFKLRYWQKTAIQNKVTEMAHYVGIRISRVNPVNTSKLAFDGSGKVTRSFRKDLASFTSGKVYHADLSASYNIGSRYFLREIYKSFSETERLLLQAKVPELAKRTYQTLSSLISLNLALRPAELATSEV